VRVAASQYLEKTGQIMQGRMIMNINELLTIKVHVGIIRSKNSRQLRIIILDKTAYLESAI
jgi:hypothetical protein